MFPAICKRKLSKVTTFKVVCYLFTVCVCLQLCACDVSRDTRDTKHNNIDSFQSIAPFTKELLESSSFQIINKIVARASIRKLVDEQIPIGSQEFRLWVGFSHNGVKGIIIRKNMNSYSAMYIPPLDESTFTLAPQLLPPPQAGWEVLLERLENLNFSIESDKPSEKLYPHDSMAAIVEIKTQSSYKAHKYPGILYDKEIETQRMEEAIDLLSKQFGINMY